MQIIKSILIGFLVQSWVLNAQRCKSCGQRNADFSEEALRQLRYEFLKDQILKKLHLTEAPKTNLPKPPLKSLLVIAEMTENSTAPETIAEPKIESVVIYPKDANLTCSKHRKQVCERFEFVVPESVPLDNFVGAEVWLYQRNLSEPIQVHQVVSDPLQNQSVDFKLNNSKDRNLGNWRKYDLSNLNFRSNFTNEENVLAIEVTDERNAVEVTDAYPENVVSEEEEEKPFLIIRSDVVEASSRKRRSTACVESSTSCCRENFFLNFSEIGWDNWILHPDGYQANFCRGRCFNDLSNTRFYHSAVLLSYIRDNRDLAEEIGLNMCCTPSVMAPVTIIYRNEEGLIYHKSIENMTVVACNCA